MTTSLAITALLAGLGCTPRTIVFPDDSATEALDCASSWYPDADGDGHGAQESEPLLACVAPGGFAPDAMDCDDADPSVHPGAGERCNGRDDDCDGLTDEEGAAPTTWYADGDGDGYGAAAHAVVACAAPRGFVSDAGDCADRDASIHPGARELCDGLDQDCDGEVDEACSVCDLFVPDDVVSVQAAIEAAPPGGTVCVGPGTWVENLDLGTRDLTLASTHGAALTILDGDGVDSVIRAAGGEVTVTGFTLVHGHADRGGGVAVSGGAPTLTDLRITGCTAGEGGGIYLDQALALLSDLEIEDCTAEVGSGGGIAMQDSEVRIMRSGIVGAQALSGFGGGLAARRSVLDIDTLTVQDGAAAGGGGLSLEDSHAESHELTLRANLAGADGGGGFLVMGSAWICDHLRVTDNHATSGAGGGGRADGARLTCERLRFERNSADQGDGGAIALESTVATLSWAAFVDDEAAGDGGALWLDGEAQLTLSQVVLVDNRAQDGGAVYAADTAGLQLDHLLATSNRAATGVGGALAIVDSATLNMDHAILADNQALHGAALYLRGAARLHLTAASLHANRSGASVLAEGTADALVVLAGVSVSGCGPAAAVSLSSAVSFDLDWLNVWNASSRPITGLGSHGRLGAISQADPAFLDTSGVIPLFWDLHLGPGSGLRDADTVHHDPDGSRADLGAWGGAEAGTWDLDGDGFPSWWQPNPYDPATYPAQGWDCDDLDATVFPGGGC